MTADYTYWREELRAPGCNTRDDTSRDIAGFWRIKGAKTKPDYPVAIWWEDGVELVKIGRKDPIDLLSTEGEEFRSSSWFKTEAVSDEAYNTALQTGWWPDGKPARQMSNDEKLGLSTNEGDNAAPVEESLADQIKALADSIDATPEPQTQEQANSLSDKLERMRGLLKRAEAERVAEKEPHKVAGEAVDAKWRDIKAPGMQAGVDGEARRKAFLRKEQARIDAEADAERQRLAAEAQAERERIAAEIGAKPDEVEVPVAVVEPKRATAGGTYGRSTGLRKTKVAVIVDRAKLLEHLKDDEDMIAYLQLRADKALRGKVVLPGVEQREELR